MDVALVLASGLSVATSGRAWPIKAEVNSPLPYVEYQKVGERQYLHQKGVLNTKRDRYQIRCVAATYPQLLTLVSQVNTYLAGNTTSFDVVMPTELEIEDRPEKGIYTCIREYLITYS